MVRVQQIVSDQVEVPLWGNMPAEAEIQRMVPRDTQVPDAVDIAVPGVEFPVSPRHAGLQRGVVPWRMRVCIGIDERPRLCRDSRLGLWTG